jgi:hypothetical protein
MADYDYDLGKIESSGATGIDALFEREPQLVAASSRPKRVRVASLQQIAGFQRVGAETLVHKSDRDLWSLKKEGDGKFYIERLFDDNGQPLKG